MNDDDLNLCAQVYTWNVKGECILRNVPELGGAPPTTSKSVVSAGTWGASALTQLLEWNGKVTVGDVAVVVTEASLRTAQKLPSEGATEEEAGDKLGMVPAGTMAIVVGKSPPTVAGYSERIMVKLPGFSLDDSELVAPSQPFDFYHPSTAVSGWVSKVTKSGQLRVIMAPDVKKQEFVMNSKTMTKPVQDLKKNDVCIVVSSASVRSTEALESTSTSKQKLKTVGVKLIDLPTGTSPRCMAQNACRPDMSVVSVWAARGFGQLTEDCVRRDRLPRTPAWRQEGQQGAEGIRHNFAGEGCLPRHRRHQAGLGERHYWQEPAAPHQ